MQERFVGFIVAMAAIDVERRRMRFRSKVGDGNARMVKSTLSAGKNEPFAYFWR